ncbi:hypothetical protein ABID76_002603 [Burkholderia ambifaria]
MPTTSAMSRRRRFDQVKAQIAQQLVQQKLQAFEEGLRQQAKIQ